ncbi:hypothetical protein MACJ_002546 [Theileria orientalis]|uniref:Uncharacterized protein n=1 Tax=Theileria orientalis TaxID=68886 RepID=A0A976QSF0_THEOR|nr:hypothetical protein MACJ_002546 [Theileria orientalis]
MFGYVILWEYDPNQRGGIYPRSVYHDTTNNVLVLRFTGLAMTFENTTDGWIFTESGPLAVKFHVVDPKDNNNAVELASDQFTITESGDVTTFTIADGVDCIALTYGPDLLWQHDPNQRGGKHPKSLDYNKSTDTLVLKFDGLDMSFAKNADGEWEYTETATSRSKRVISPPLVASSAKSRVKLFKVNPRNPANPLELDANEYTSTATGNVVTYKIARNVNCVKLMFGYVILWEYDPNQRGGIYPRSVYHDTTTNVLVLRFTGLAMTFENTTDGWIFTESGPLAVKFHVVDPKDNNNAVELASDQFTITESGDVTTFTIADGVDCIALTYGPDLLWQHDPNQRGGKHPKSLDYNKSTDTLVLKFDGLDMSFAKNADGEWEYTETDISFSNTDITLTKISPEPLSTFSSTDSFTDIIHTRSSSTLTSRTIKNGFDLDISSDTKSCIKFEYDKVGRYVTYSAKDNYAFKLVKDDNTVIWKTTDFINTYRVEVDLMNYDAKALIVYMGSTKFVFMKDGYNKPWNDIDLAKVNPKSININSEHESYFYKNKLDNNVRKFTAKTGFTFKGAHEYVDNNKIEIWKTDKESEYATKIVNEGGNKVTIHLANGSTKVIEKGSDGKWPEVTDTSTTSTDTSHKTGVHLNIKSDTESNNKLHYKKDGKIATYTALDGFGFASVKYNGDSCSSTGNTLWEAKSDKYYASKVEHIDYWYTHMEEINIYLYDGTKRKFYKNLNMAWTEVDLYKLNPKPMNISMTEETYYQTPITRDGFKVFVSKPPFIFDKLIQSPWYERHSSATHVWSTTDPNEYVKEVFQDSIGDSSISNVTMHLINGDYRHVKYLNSNWVERSSHIELDLDHKQSTFEYTYTENKYIRTYEPKFDFVFSKVQIHKVSDCGDSVTIWERNNSDGYTKKIVAKGDTNLTIYIGDDRTPKVFYKVSEGKWKEDTEASTKATKISCEPYSIFSPAITSPKTGIDININVDIESTDKFDYEKDGQHITYTPKGNYAFKLVKEDHTELWNAIDHTNYSQRIDVDVMNKDAIAVTIYMPGNKTKVFMKSCKNEHWAEIGKSQLDDESFNIDYPYETYFYTNNLRGNIRTFISKTGFTFKDAIEVIDNNRVEIWKTSNKNEYAYKIEVDLMNNDSKAVTVYMARNKTKVFRKDCKNDPWTEINISEIKPMLVDITDDKETYFYSNKFDNDVRTFTAKKGFAFNFVNDGTGTNKIEIWKTDKESEYANKIVVDLMHTDTKAVTIHLPENNTKVFKKQGKNHPWDEIDTSKLNPEPLNIDYSHETHSYKNELKSRIRTFTPKTGFAFNCVNEYVNDKKVEIWKTDNESGYANKIEVDLINNDTKAVTIYLPEDKTKVFWKYRKNDRWIDLDTTEVIPKSININYLQECYIYKNELKNNVRTFTAKKGFIFKGTIEFVDDNKVEVWKPTKESEYSNKIEVDLMNKDAKAVTFYLPENKTKVFKKDAMNDDWTEIDITIINPMSVNISTDYETYFYSTTLQGSTKIFEPRNGFAFKAVNEYIGIRKVEIWTSKQNEYAKKVEYARRTSGKLDVTIHMDNNEKLLFVKESEFKGWKEIDITVINPKTVNIKYPYKSYFYDIKLHNGVRTFEARDGFVFNVVSEYIGNKRVEIWSTTKENEYAKKVVTKGDNKLIIYIGESTSAYKKVFTKEADGKWRDGITAATTVPPLLASSPKSRVKLLKVNPSDAADLVEIDANEYTSTATGSIVTYKIARGVNCVQLLFDDVLLWAHDSTHHGGIYPRSVYHTSTDVLILRFTGLDMTFENTTDGWIFTESGPLAVKFHVVDPKDNNNAVELASDQFTVTEIGDITTFNINTGVDPIALTYGPGLLWQHDPNQRGGKHPKSLDYNKSTDTLVLKFDGLDMSFAKNADGEWEYTETATSRSKRASSPTLLASSPKSRVKLLKVNPSDAADLVEIDANEYTSTATGNVVTYKIARNVNCVQLLFDDVLLWAHDSTHHGGICPESIYHDTNTDVLVLRFQGLDLTFENTNEGWIFTESGPLAVKFHVVDPNDSNNTVELANNQFTSTTSGDVTTFTIADGVDCIALTYGPDLLWQHDPNERGGIYPKSLDYNKSTDTLVLKFDGLDMTFAKNANGAWEYTETQTSGSGAATTPPISASTQSRVKLLKANLSDPSSPLELDANEYTSTATGSVVTYKIARGVNCVQLLFDDVLLWAHDSTHHGGIYPRSVYHTSTDVLILRFTGLAMTFENTTDGWIFTESGPLAVKFHVVDPKDNNNAVELASDQFTVTEIGDITTFNINTGVDPIALTYGPGLLWQHDPNQRGGKHPKSLDYNKSTDTLVLKFDGLDMSFAKNADGEWEYTETDISEIMSETTLAESGYATQPEDGFSTTGDEDADLSREKVTSATVRPLRGPSRKSNDEILKTNPSSTAKPLELPRSIYPRSVYYDTTTNALILRFTGLDMTFGMNTQGLWGYKEIDIS